MFKKLRFCVVSLFFLGTGHVMSQCSVSIINFPHGDCEGTDIELIALPSGGTNGYSFQWVGPNGFSSTNQFVYISQASMDETGMYSVTATSLSNGCTAQAEENVIKNPSPVVYTGGQQGGCIGETTQIYAQDFAGNFGPYIYSWEGGQSTQYIDVAHNGTAYPAPACTITNAFGCSSTNNSTFLIYTYNSPQIPVIEAASATTFCKGGTVELIASDIPDVTYQWRKGPSDIINATGSTYTASILGNYRVVVTNIFSCTALSNKVTISVIDKPQASITVNGSANLCNGSTVSLMANSGNNYSYQWKRNGIIISGASQQEFIAATKGNYRVVVTNQFGCTRVSPFVAVTQNCRENFDKTGNKSYAFDVFPNPSQNYFTIRLPGIPEENKSISITDMAGRIVETTGRIQDSEIICGSDLPAGTYMLHIENESQNYSKLIIKTN